MRWIVGRSLRFRWLVLFAAVAMMALGVSQIPSAKVDVFPEFAPPQVEIHVDSLVRLQRVRAEGLLPDEEEAEAAQEELV